MNSHEIDRFLRARLCDFVGVFSVDNMPEYARLLVCNTDPSDKPGRHWMAIYIEDGCRDLFDSFGHGPNVDFERYMNSHCMSWNFNEKRLQSVVREFCG